MNRLKKHWANISDKRPFRRPAREHELNTDVPFLRLPFDIRHRIYILAGLVRACPVDLNRPAKNYATDHRVHCIYRDVRAPGSSRKGLGWDADCGCGPVPVQLLYTCRSVSKECSTILYSENRFKICRVRGRGFGPIRGLSGPTIGSVKSLSVLLNVCSCALPRAHLLSSDYHHTCIGGPCDLDDQALAQWRDLCKWISANVKPSQLGLFVVCDSGSHGAALKVVEPLSRMPVLRTCSIRFGRGSDHSLRLLARESGYQLMGNSRRKPSRRLTSLAHNIHLPPEIVRQILGHYSHLVANHGLRWATDSRFKPNECCGSCSDTPEACCCPGRQIAFSENCTCWRMPTELFLVCSAWRQVATEIFYQRNHFVVDLAKQPQFKRQAPPLLEFLSSIPSHALEHLRSIECVLPQLTESPWTAETRDHLHWVRAIDFVAKNLRIDKLSLRFNMSADARHWHHLYHLSHLGHMSLQDIIDLHINLGQSYECVVAPLINWPPSRRLANFFLYLGLDSTDANQSMERTLETKVMGEDYDAIAQGKFREDRRWISMAKCCWEAQSSTI